jgi:hypothetical protein
MHVFELEVKIISGGTPVDGVVRGEVILVPQLQVDVDGIVVGVHRHRAGPVGPEVGPVGAAEVVFVGVAESLTVDQELGVVIVPARLAFPLAALHFDHPVQVDGDLHVLGLGCSGREVRHHHD